MKQLIQIFVIVLFAKSVHLRKKVLTRKGGHGGAHDISVRDDCSNVLKPHGKHYKLRYLNFPGVNWTCCAANPGFKIVGPCLQGKPNTTVVERCEEGTYISEFAHIRKKCDVDDLVCPDPFIKIPSNITEKPECVCQNGFFLNESNKCIPYSKCSPGWGVYRHGNPHKDTMCKPCKRGFVSPTWSSTERCLLNLNFSGQSAPTEATKPNHESFTEMPIYPYQSISYTLATRSGLEVPDGCELPDKQPCDPFPYGTIACVFGLTVLTTSLAWMLVIMCFQNTTKSIQSFSKLRCGRNRCADSQTSRNGFADNDGDSSEPIAEYVNENDTFMEERVNSTYTRNEVSHNSNSDEHASSDNCNFVEERSSLLESHEESPPLSKSFRATSTKSLADADKEFEKKTKEFKMFLAEKVDLDETKDLYRSYSSDPNPEIFLNDCKLHNMYTKDIFHAVWSRLEKRGTERFNPTIVLEFFVFRENNSVADEIKEKFSDLI